MRLQQYLRMNKISQVNSPHRKTGALTEYKQVAAFFDHRPSSVQEILS